MAIQDNSKKKELSVHDRLFKILFGTHRFIELLQKLWEMIFTLAEKKIMQTSMLRLESGTSTGNGFKEMHADVTSSVELKEPHTDQRLLMVMDHKSHQSKQDIPQLRGYQEKLAKHYGWPVIPVFFYHGKALWRKPLFFQDQFQSLKDIPESLLKFVSVFYYRLIDVQSMEIEKIKDPVIRLIFFAFQQIWFLKQEQGRVLRVFFHYAKRVNKKYEEIINILLAYFLEYDDTLTWDQLRMVAEETCYKEGGKVMETLKYTVEGAMERGLQAGRQEGLQAKEQSVILKMLKDKVNIQTIMKYTGVSKERILELQKQAGF